jgi:hypothetical protein
MRPFPRRLGLVATLATALLIPGSASAFPLTNCTLEVTSVDAAGAAVDSATGPSGDASQGDPFIVDWDGKVVWNGSTGSQVITNNSWFVNVYGIPTPLRGSGANEDGTADGDGTVDVSTTLPFKLTGLYYISGEISGEGGSCSGSGWVKLEGDPVGTFPFFLALALVVIGALLIALGARGGWVPALVGGLLFGIGLGMLLVGFSSVPIGSLTLAGAVLLGLLIGALAAWLGGSRRASMPA